MRDAITPQRARSAAFALLLLVPTIAECLLADRKFGIFSGGFGASHVIDGWGEWAVFATTLVMTQLLIAGLVWWLVARLHARRWNGWLFPVNIAFVATGVALGLLAAKYEVLRYFSDTIGFALIRNLGGGSMTDAALYVAAGGGGYALGVLAIFGGYALLVRFALRYEVPAAPAPYRPGKRFRIALVGAALLIPAIILLAQRTGDLRFTLGRFNTYALARMTLSFATDFDRDGYSWFSAKIDTAPFDPTRHPLALDIPDNGIDEDGFGGDFVLDAAPAPAVVPRLPQRPMHVVIVVLESTRADVIGKRIRGKTIAPNLEAIAASGSAATAYSHVGFTTNSLKSLFTGALTPVDDRQSLFRDLKQAGYRTATISGQPESFGDIARTTGMDRFGDLRIDAETLKDQRALGFAAKGSLRIDESKLMHAFERHFGHAEDWAKPVFLYMNFQSPHFPYHHPGITNRIELDPVERSEITPENSARVIGTYWNAVAWSDMWLGRLVARLKTLGVYGDTLLVVTADHGESLFDDGFLGHGHKINRQQTAIPLVINRAGAAPSGAIGLQDYRDIILALVAESTAPARDTPVFQYVGELDTPSEIGMVDAAGGWTVLDPATEELRFNDDRAPIAYRTAKGADRIRADRLVRLWSEARWRQHLLRR